MPGRLRASGAGSGPACGAASVPALPPRQTGMPGRSRGPAHQFARRCVFATNPADQSMAGRRPPHPKMAQAAEDAVVWRHCAGTAAAAGRTGRLAATGSCGTGGHDFTRRGGSLRPHPGSRSPKPPRAHGKPPWPRFGI
ncbi:Hypothetical protein bglu_1g14820 [Burkholderia glumae BGR1]|nr:Hypothetical protein bglu_1g14820 [Burkholderia glumae BGR1]